MVSLIDSRRTWTLPSTTAFEDGFDPFADGASRTATRHFSDRLRNSVASHVRNVVAPALDYAAQRLAPDGRYDIHVGEDGETIRFVYPSAVEAPDSYVASGVLLEFGGRNVIDPNERHVIVPDIAALTDGLEYPTATITVLSPARTFWEKATLIHVACHRRQLANKPDRLSRHWFDLACLATHPVGRAALADRALLADVVRHKKVFFHAGNANYDHCLDGQLRLIPDDQFPALQSDYEAMRGAHIVGDDAPKFNALIDRIRSLETEANLAFAPASQSSVQPSPVG